METTNVQRFKSTKAGDEKSHSQLLKRNYLYDPQYGLLESPEKMPNVAFDNKKLSTTIFPTLIDDIKPGKGSQKISKKIPVRLHRKMMSVDEGIVKKQTTFKKTNKESE